MDLETAGRSARVADCQQVPSQGPAGHLCVGEVVSYIDRTLASQARARVEYHLVHCEACLQEIVEVTLFLREPTGPEGKPSARAGALAVEGEG